ncbi:unnamed protein product [Prorocentrum cordatum]|uniref:Uncharacterized protein n=1 Tax=Prorocentrum cordatum TaxID=2364126 RepID=A0ABN9S9P2_9DINO|nr:unnamed protein product [Polarella glacialis]
MAVDGADGEGGSDLESDGWADALTRRARRRPRREPASAAEPAAAGGAATGAAGGVAAAELGAGPSVPPAGGAAGGAARPPPRGARVRATAGPMAGRAGRVLSCGAECAGVIFDADGLRPKERAALGFQDLVLVGGGATGRGPPSSSSR